MRIKITDISPAEWKALGFKDMTAPLRIGETTVRVVLGRADRDLRQVIDPERGPAGVEYGGSMLELDVELLAPPSLTSTATHQVSGRGCWSA